MYIFYDSYYMTTKRRKEEPSEGDDKTADEAIKDEGCAIPREIFMSHG